MTKPRADIAANTLAFETEALIKPAGFREYDARWWFGHAGSDRAPELNLVGVQALGQGLAAIAFEKGVEPTFVVGHDYRSYSLSIKQALMLGLMSGGAKILDIGLALSPTAYFAQFDLDAPCVAMVTASHNENGWTGVKMGVERPLTFGPDDMSRLKEIVLSGTAEPRPGGAYERVDGVRERYIADVSSGPKLTRPLKAVAACGNGTAGAFAPEALRRLGAEVIELDCALDHSFPRYNPNPEDLEMLGELEKAVKEHGADVGLAFDGDGDRCGVVDDEGVSIYADKVGVLLARDFAAQHPGASFVVDVKSTALFETDPELQAAGAKTVYWKTGHSYIKRRAKELGAVAGFEKSGHYFFQPPFGRGYDDGIAAAAAVLRMLERNPGKSMSDLRRSLPTTWSSPTMAPECADEKKYGVVEAMTETYLGLQRDGAKILGQPIKDVVTVNGARVVLEDGTWGLVRASSNKPSLVVVVESPTSEDIMRAMFADIETRLADHSEVGAFDQKL
ncbi:MAG: phosphomannomutase/phosphoglucomutase [Maricaulaceae bacterium]|jgi:phosphomannomutase/phosphoglucomutase